MILFFIFISLVEPRENSRGRDSHKTETPPHSASHRSPTTTWPSTTKLPPTTTSERSDTTRVVQGTILDATQMLLYPTSPLTNSSLSTGFYAKGHPATKLPQINSSNDSKNYKRSYTTHTYPRDPKEDFVFIWARNESDLDEITAFKCNQSGEMDLYYGELDNKCIYLIFCCGPNKHPEKTVEYMPRRNGLANQAVKAP